MSAEDRLNEKPSRRRGLRRQAEEEAVNNIEEDNEAEDEGMEDDGGSSSRGVTAGKGRPTPSRRTAEIETVKQEGNFITRTFGGMREYMEGVGSERQKIVWPNREETQHLTYIVLVVTIISSIVLGVIALIFNTVLDAGLKSPGLIFGGMFVFSLVAFGAYLRNSNRRTSGF
jgi:preprotein translocase SecE subunit